MLSLSLELLLKISSPGSPDLDPEPAALLCLRDVQGEQLQVRRRQEAHHPTVLDYYFLIFATFPRSVLFS